MTLTLRPRVLRPLADAGLFKRACIGKDENQDPKAAQDRHKVLHSVSGDLRALEDVVTGRLVDVRPLL